MKNINWFGRKYYGKNMESSRSFWEALRCFIDFDVRRIVLGEGWYIINQQYIKHYWWNKWKTNLLIQKKFKEEKDSNQTLRFYKGGILFGNALTGIKLKIKNENS